ncbi:MAG: dihydroxyacetone kinase phosphoryl donor subunit DhaM [Propionibacteriaceae bacterium]|nr:dihydroxyacetone kinase phosphoryl donor subunit DhaM [Propionibacteriaceae bacterium]
MIGIVVVSHSQALGTAAAQLAAEMVPDQARPQLRVAAGLDEVTLGTDAAAIAEAITAVDSPDGVLVLVDLGSAILSAEMALEFVEPEVSGRTVISPAPLVEGLIAALVTASTGASLEEVAQEAVRGLVGKQEQLSDSESMVSSTQPLRDTGNVSGEPASGVASDKGGLNDTGGATTPVRPLIFSWSIRNPHGLHARPAAALVSGMRGFDATIDVSNSSSGKGPVSASSLTLLQTLGLRQGDQMEVRISGKAAHEALDQLTLLANDDFGEGQIAQKSIPARTATTRPATGDGQVGKSPARTGQQIAIGPALHVRLTPDLSGYHPLDPCTEETRLDQAAAQVTNMLRRLLQESPQGIYEVQELMLSDALEHVREDIQRGSSAVDAVQAWFTSLSDQLQAIDDPYLRARAEDQRGLRRMMLRALTGQPITAGTASGILIVQELDPVTAGSVDPDRCLGIITTSGGATGHGALLAQARGMALVTGCEQAEDVPDGTTVAIDPVNNRVWISPSPDEVDALTIETTRRADAAQQASHLSQDPAVTRTGARILVEANISSVHDAIDADQAGADGSGLIRTEVLFGAWDREPSAEEQADVFIQIGTALEGRMVTVRAWDPGGDKPLAFLPQDPEANPMLGERGIRAIQRLPHLLDEQLTAVLLASKEILVRVMVPMIAVPDEMVWVRSRMADLERAVGRQVLVGMMVETPAAALCAQDFTAVADFISFGTNDLTQYTLAADRGNPHVAKLSQGPITAVWDLIGIAARAFAGKPVGVCGDLASRPDAVGRLIDLGVTELSVRPPLIGTIKEAVRSWDPDLGA